MTAPALKLKPLLKCERCNAEITAGCSCGVSYVPASIRAADALAADPEKSDRAIAEDIGVGKDTVRRARKATGAPAPVKRTGLDGKKRRAPRPKTTPAKAEPQPAAAGSFNEALAMCIENLADDPRKDCVIGVRALLKTSMSAIRVEDRQALIAEVRAEIKHIEAIFAKGDETLVLPDASLLQQ
jgi:hypothetical protein